MAMDVFSTLKSCLAAPVHGHELMLVDDEQWSCTPCKYPSITVSEVRGACKPADIATLLRQHGHMEKKIPPPCPALVNSCGQTYFLCATSAHLQSRGSSGNAVWGFREEEVETPKQQLAGWRAARFDPPIVGPGGTAEWQAPVHYYRIPKTGSSALIKHLFGRLKCRLVMHDHTDGGVDLAWLSGLHFRTAHPEQTIVSIREPCDRFKSMHAHMLRNSRAYAMIVKAHAGRDEPGRGSTPPTYDEAIAWLMSLARERGCGAQSTETLFATPATAKAVHPRLAHGRRHCSQPSRTATAQSVNCLLGRRSQG